jgi:APA family basic amino acid/polyamine antiporter
MSTSAPEQAGLFTTKPVDALVADTKSKEHQLARSVGLLDLSALGLGAIIGTGIFVILGEAIGDAGPAIVLSFVLAGLTCAFSALSYAEMASAIPVAGSAYTYSYATMGELIAWIIGWDLILEYGVSVAAVAVGWGGYLNELLSSAFGFTLPNSISQPPGEGGVVNLPAVFVVLAVAGLLIAGFRESARTNTVMVVIKVSILVLFIVLAFTAFNSDNLEPFAPGGTDGIVTAASLIFFAYIGFDAISTSGEETKRPQRDLPIAILGSLFVATLLYILVALAAAGAIPFADLEGSEAPLAIALDQGAGFGWGATVISIGALVAITSVVLTVLYGQTRIMFAMSRDGLVPRWLAYVHPKTRTPVYTTVGFALLIAVLAAVVPLAEIAKLVNIGTLFAFLLVNIGVMVLRRTKPDLERGFRVPFVWVCAPIGCLLCIYLMLDLPRTTWERFLIWLAAGLVIYFLYGRRHSRLRRGEVINPEAQFDEGRAS